VARTMMRNVDDVDWVIDEYMYQRGYLRGMDRDECIAVAHALYLGGKVHQPRMAEAYTGQSRVPEDFVWMDVVPSKVQDFPAVQEAWENYQLMLRLCENLPEAEEAPKN
jgi:hypothetical protein